MNTVEMLRELEASATPGPWFCEGFDRYNQPVVRNDSLELLSCWHHSVESIEREAIENCRLVAAMRNALPALLRVADAAKARFEVWTPETYQELKEALGALEEADNG